MRPNRKHSAACTICSHSDKDEIEREWIAWGNTSQLAKKFHVSRDSLYRHAHALNLFEKRRRNLRAGLERIVEKADSVQVNASAVVAAATALAKINGQGAWIERVESLDVNALFDKMSAAELESYARDGNLPEWFPVSLSATDADSQEEQLQAQNGGITAPDNKIPDLKGIWEINMPNLCGYVNILDETVPPAPYCGVPPDTSTTIQITDQSGRVFAGSHVDSSDKFTGIIEFDGTISLQYWSTDPQEWEHIFLKAKLYRENGDYVMRGYFHGKSELPMPAGQGGVPYANN
jgi:hypothetical protein